MTEHLTSDELTRLTMARCLLARREAELRAATAALDLCLMDIQEEHAIGPGDKVTPQGEILRGGAASA